MTPLVTLLARRGRAASCVPQLPACFRGGGDSGLVRKSARKRLIFTQNCPRARRQLPGEHRLRARLAPRRYWDGSTRSAERVAHEPRARPSPRRARAGPTLSAHAVALDRLRMPPPAHLLGLCRRGARSLRAVGRWLDGAGAARPLPSVRNLRPRFRGGGAAAGRTLVPALALRPLARDQCRPRAAVRGPAGERSERPARRLYNVRA